MTFEEFLKDFVPKVELKSQQLNQACWILETTGSADAASLKGSLDTELRMLFNDPAIYQSLLIWSQEAQDPLQKRELNVLIRSFKQNQIPKQLLEEMAQKEAALAQSYAAFRPAYEGRKLSENEIRSILKEEKDPVKRRKVWEASKEIGTLLAPQILALVRLRNQAAQILGYSDYFQMQLDLQEVDSKWLLSTFETLSQQSEKGYMAVIAEIGNRPPWGWSDPFCQEDPLDQDPFDEGIDIMKTSVAFYRDMGIDVQSILDRSDMYERAGKNQHAFCMNLDRAGDVRTLNNVKPTLKWYETVLHELGHAIYELGFDDKLPWLLREPPHMITTEAMALIAGRQAYQKVRQSLRRRQLIFSRWVLVMTAFESELYRDPSQDLNRLWWQLVEKYQKIEAPKNRTSKADWAAKYHIGLAPVYYFSYLLGEMFASAIQESLVEECGSSVLNTPQAGQFLRQKLFSPGNRMRWDELIEHVTGRPLTAEAWVKEFAT